MGIYVLNASIKPMFTLPIFKKDCIFFSSILYWNIFVNFKTIQYYKSLFIILYVAIISYILQIHQIALTIDMRKKIQENGWEVLSLQLFFRIFWLTEIYNPLDYFRVGIIEEIRLFFPWRGRPSP